MKVCLIVEGSYPYVNGGVSSWVHQLIQAMPEVEFVIQTIVASSEESLEYKYRIPDNVSKIQTVYLMDDDYIDGNIKKKIKLTEEEYDAFESLMFGENTQWETLMKFFAEKDVSLNALLSGKDFFNMTLNFYKENYSRAIFSEFLWSMRSMYLPLFMIMKLKTEPADLYHSASCGYAGLWGSMEKYLHKAPFLMTEHGIYTREREEEIIKAKWVKGLYKDLWIKQFKKIGECCYLYADQVVSLFDGARKFQIELGCDGEKAIVIPNGVDYEKMRDIPQKDADDPFINIGAVLRVTPIKDVKTLISAYALAKKKNPKLKLWIMGGMDEDEEYAQECIDMVEHLHIEDVIFTGIINVREYIGKMDFMILSSISEGQPLSILEGFAAHKPSIATNVGNCKGLLYGNDDQLGRAGYIVPVMGVSEIAATINKMAKNTEKRKKMGEIGYQRVIHYHDQNKVFKQYLDLYQKLVKGSEL